MPSYAIAPIFPSAGSIGKLRAGLSPNGHPGPTSYVALATTGDPLPATEFGFLWLMFVIGGYTSNKLYQVIPLNPTVGPSATIPLQWIDVSSGLEVIAGTDLSASTVNLFALGL